MLILRYFTGIFAWLIVIVVNLAAIACTLFLYVKAGVIGRAREGLGGTTLASPRRLSPPGLKAPPGFKLEPGLTPA